MKRENITNDKETFLVKEIIAIKLILMISQKLSTVLVRFCSVRF